MTEITISPVESENNILTKERNSILANELIPISLPTDTTKPSYGIENAGKLILDLLAIVKIVVSYIGTKSVWGLLLNPILLVKNIIAMANAAIEISKIFPDAWKEVKDLNLSESQQIFNILMDGLKEVLSA